jgi:hypothetical protein
MKKALFLSVVLTVGMSIQAYGFVQMVNTTIRNDSDRCAWITLYVSRPGIPWVTYDAFWVKSGKPWRQAVVVPNPLPPITGVPTPVPAEIRVRAEFMSDSACSHPVVKDTSGEKKGIWFSGSPGDPGASPDASFFLNQRKQNYWVSAN